MPMPVGITKITTSTSAAKGIGDGTMPSLPAGLSAAYVAVEGGDVRWRDDGNEPTSTFGQKCGENIGFRYDGNPANLRFIAVSGTPDVFVTLYADAVGPLVPYLDPAVAAYQTSGTGSPADAAGDYVRRMDATDSEQYLRAADLLSIAKGTGRANGRLVVTATGASAHLEGTTVALAGGGFEFLFAFNPGATAPAADFVALSVGDGTDVGVQITLDRSVSPPQLLCEYALDADPTTLIPLGSAIVLTDGYAKWYWVRVAYDPETMGLSFEVVGESGRLGEEAAFAATALLDVSSATIAVFGGPVVPTGQSYGKLYRKDGGPFSDSERNAAMAAGV